MVNEPLIALPTSAAISSPRRTPLGKAARTLLPQNPRRARSPPQDPRRAKDADHYQGDLPPPNLDGKRSARRASIPHAVVDDLQRDFAQKLDKQEHLLAINGSSTTQAARTLARAERTSRQSAARAVASTLESERPLSAASDAPDTARLKRPRACNGGEDSGDRCLSRRV